MMKTRTVIFSEPIHHVCLMYGVRKTFERMPFLNKKLMEIRGKQVIIDNVVPSPPMMTNPVRRRGSMGKRNMVGVSYWSDKLCVEYREDLCSGEDITEFVNILIENYLHYRHPYMKTVSQESEVLEAGSGHRIAVISE